MFRTFFSTCTVSINFIAFCLARSHLFCFLIPLPLIIFLSLFLNQTNDYDILSRILLLLGLSVWKTLKSFAKYKHNSTQPNSYK